MSEPGGAQWPSPPPTGMMTAPVMHAAQGGAGKVTAAASSSHRSAFRSTAASPMPRLRPALSFYWLMAPHPGRVGHPWAEPSTDGARTADLTISVSSLYEYQARSGSLARCIVSH